MTMEKKLGNAVIRIVRGDVTLMDVDAFVFYAQHSLNLGSGIGNAIAQRAGPAVQEELKKIGRLETGQAVLTAAGELAARHIIHAVGPRFQESDTEQKLRATVDIVLDLARAAKIARLALAPLGVGFYGVPLPLSARVTATALREHLTRGSTIEEIIIGCTDTREIGPFEAALNAV